ncbi:MAG: type II secretion system F family protein, partial [Phycisphaeraceae bacterium]|nr:type II secretion system F family protein [Phycisphaeraceae bacterium]
MPTFQYEALNDTGKPQKGTVDAADNDDAIARIRAQGLFPTSVREQKVKKTKDKGGGGGKSNPAASGSKKKKDWKEISINIGGVSQKMLTTFTRQFSTLQDAGLPILRSIEILAEQQKPGLLKDSLEAVHEDVASGTSLSDAMAKHPKAFNNLYTKMIAAGEVGGVLDLILQRLAEFMEKAAKLKKRIIGAMVYPAVVISVAVIIVMGIMILIVPKFKKIFEDFDTDMPALTKFLMASSNWIAGKNADQMVPGAVWILFVPPGIYYFIKLVRKSKTGKAIVDRLMLKIPVAGGLIAKSTIAKFTRTLGTLIHAGVPILDAIKIVAETT